MEKKGENKTEKKVSNTAKRTAAAKAASKKNSSVDESAKADVKSSDAKPSNEDKATKVADIKKAAKNQHPAKAVETKEAEKTAESAKAEKPKQDEKTAEIKKAAEPKQDEIPTKATKAEDLKQDEKTEKSSSTNDLDETTKKEEPKTDGNKSSEAPKKEETKNSSDNPAHAASTENTTIPGATAVEQTQKLDTTPFVEQATQDAQKEEKKQEILGKHAARMEQYEKEKAEKARKKRNAKITGICFGAVAAIYLIGVILFSNFTYPQTYLGDFNLSFKTLTSLTQTLSQASDDYTLSVEGLGLELEISGQSIDYNFDANDVANKIVRQQNAFLWPFEITQLHTFEDNYVVNFDESKLTALVNPVVEAHNAAAVKPVNAGFNINVNAKTATVKPEVIGNTLDGEKTLATIKSCVGSSIRELELTDEHQVLPSIVSSDSRMENALSAANTMLQSVMTFTMGTTPVTTLTATEFGPWIEVSPDYNAILNQEAAYVWAGTMSENYNTVGTARTFTTPYGKTLSVTSSMGWEIDEDGLVTTLNENVAKGTTVTVAVPCISSTDSYLGKGARDWGNRYIDVDLSTQTVRMYDDSGAQIFETACVTGKPATPTPSGMFTVYSKASPTVLNAEDGSYHTPVQYWMPFSGGCGFHDATWQSAFGGDRWCTGYGSHGCVNLSLAAAGQLYGLCRTGDIVIVHS